MFSFYFHLTVCFVYWRACTFNLFNVCFQPPSVFNYKICNRTKQTQLHTHAHASHWFNVSPFSCAVSWICVFNLLWLFFVCCCSRCVWSTQRSTANRPTNQPTTKCCSVHTVHDSDSEWRCLRTEWISSLLFHFFFFFELMTTMLRSFRMYVQIQRR